MDVQRVAGAVGKFLRSISVGQRPCPAIGSTAKRRPMALSTLDRLLTVGFPLGESVR